MAANSLVNSALPDLQSALRTPRQARLLVVSFNGTWAGGVLSSDKTVVSEFVKLISDHENVFEIPVNGVGSDVSWVDWLLGGVGGWGTLRNVITALKNIAKHYKPGDRIILIGYSRGAWAARFLAVLIDLVSLPINADERFFHRLYKSCDQGAIYKRGASQELREGYECWPEIRISALCCFDTVGSLGVPLTGIARPLAVLCSWKKKPDIISDVALNVEYSFHCLSLHETREPYSPTLMRGSNVHQVFFPGGHGNLGRIEDTEGLVHAPFAWMIQQLHTHQHISFDEAKLAARFPSYLPCLPSTQSLAASPNESPISPLKPNPEWCRGRVQHISSGLLAIIGKKSRKPGHINCPGGATDLKVHIGARLRNNLDGINTVPGYTLMVPVTGMPYWERRAPQSRWTRRSSFNSDSPSMNTLKSKRRHWNRWPELVQSVEAAEWIEEAKVGALEARLLGLPQEAVMLA